MKSTTWKGLQLQYNLENELVWDFSIAVFQLANISQGQNHILIQGK